jgi:hypothetical protein
MIMLRPKNSFESVVNELAAGLASGTIRLSTELKDAEEPTPNAVQKSLRHLRAGDERAQ